MKCPACSSALSRLTFGGVEVEVCREGCGGIWFDKSELERFDEACEEAPESLLRAMKNKQAVVDLSRARQCPKCANATLNRGYTNSDNQIEVDSCKQCEGIWLDLGELSQLRDKNTTDTERDKVINDYAQKYRKEIESGKIPKRILAVFKLIF